MEIKILQVFYGSDGLPYKDQERKVHFPIIGSGFQGASNTTKIKMYFEQLGDRQTSWVATAKLPNGKIGSKVLSTYTDTELGEDYALLELDSFYFQYKGDVFISLQGYEGGVEVEYDSTHEIYTIVGTPTIQATGSIKLAVNYATQFIGSGQENNITLQQLLAFFSTKLDISELPNIVYGTDGEGEQLLISYTNLPTAGTIPIRNSDGNFRVGTPENNGDAANKYYIDNIIAGLNRVVPKHQATMTVIIDALRNINARFLSSYEATPYTNYLGYDFIQITKGSNVLTVEEAKDYMEYMTGSRFLPIYEYEKPCNSIFLMSDGTFWKPQYNATSNDDPLKGLILYRMESPLAIASNVVSRTSNANKVYGTTNGGSQTTFTIDQGTNYDGNVVRRNSSSQIYVPTTPTADAHAASKYYVDQVASTIKQNEFEVADYTEYTTLADFMSDYADAEEGIIYLYPIDTSDLTKGYYQLIWEGNDWIELGTTVIDLSDYYSKSASLIPSANNTYDLGSASYTFKDLYLSGKIDFGGNFSIKVDNNLLKFYYNTTAHIGLSTNTIYVNTTMGTGNVRPQTNNQNDLGASSTKWKDLYLQGSIYGATYSETFDDVYTTINNLSSADSGTVIKWSQMLTFSKSANTTFTFETAKTGCLNEYKAVITNSGSSSITITLPSGTKIITNDDNITISTNTFTLPSGVSVELNCVNQCCVIVNFEA